MPSLTQCWYTRIHVPANRGHRDEEGALVSECRYCHKSISSWSKGRWHLADGFNVSQLRDKAGRHLYVIDVVDDFVIARYPIDAKEKPTALKALKEQLRVKHGLDQPGCTCQIRDSKDERALH